MKAAAGRVPGLMLGFVFAASALAGVAFVATGATELLALSLLLMTIGVIWTLVTGED